MAEETKVRSSIDTLVLLFCSEMCIENIGTNSSIARIQFFHDDDDDDDDRSRNPQKRIVYLKNDYLNLTENI